MAAGQVITVALPGRGTIPFNYIVEHVTRRGTKAMARVSLPDGMDITDKLTVEQVDFINQEINRPPTKKRGKK